MVFAADSDQRRPPATAGLGRPYDIMPGMAKRCGDAKFIGVWVRAKSQRGVGIYEAKEGARRWRRNGATEEIGTEVVGWGIGDGCKALATSCGLVQLNWYAVRLLLLKLYKILQLM